MVDDYNQHLAALHATFETSDALVRQAAGAVTASPIVLKTRIVHGEANEVYALTFESGLEVIVRIARRADGIFEKERWAIERCLALGVAVPKVLSIQRLVAETEPLDLCIVEKLPGDRLSDSLILPPQTLRSIVREVGEQLSRLHTIKAADLGDGARFFGNDSDEFLATKEQFIQLSIQAGIERAAVRRGFMFVETTLAQEMPSPRCLTHNDLRACHVLVHDGRLSGLIDFGQVSIDSPVNEFAKWDYWEAPDLPVEWLMEGYTEKSLFDEHYGEAFAALRIANGLWALRWYSLTGYAFGVARAKDRLVQYIAQLDLC